MIAVAKRASLPKKQGSIHFLYFIIPYKPAKVKPAGVTNNTFFNGAEAPMVTNREYGLITVRSSQPGLYSGSGNGFLSPSAFSGSCFCASSGFCQYPKANPPYFPLYLLFKQFFQSQQRHSFLALPMVRAFGCIINRPRSLFLRIARFLAADDLSRRCKLFLACGDDRTEVALK